MGPFAEFVERLLATGSAALSQRPAIDPSGAREAAAVLERAYRSYLLEVAGPPPPFDAEAAAAAAGHVWSACWFLTNRDEEEDAVASALDFGAAGTSAAAHLSADLTLRYLAAVHRRARALDAADVLTRALTRTLRAWPLSGVLADVAEPPTSPVEFAGHAGALLLYAERLAANPRPAWVAGGPAREYIDLVFAERGLRVPGVDVSG